MEILRGRRDGHTFHAQDGAGLLDVRQGLRGLAGVQSGETDELAGMLIHILGDVGVRHIRIEIATLEADHDGSIGVLA